jgi:hypothetical protein
VENPAQKISIRATRNALEKISSHWLHPFVRDRPGDHAGLIEKNAPARRMAVQNIHQLAADSTADIGNQRKASPIEGGSDRRRHRRTQRAHRFVENRRFLRMLLKELPIRPAEHMIVGGLSGLDAVQDSRPSIVLT